MYLSVRRGMTSHARRQNIAITQTQCENATGSWADVGIGPYMVRILECVSYFNRNP
jgi:hypothetical protein